MTNRLHIKEALAWTAVLLSLILLSATVAFAQTRTVNITSENGKVHIVSKSTENGKTTTKDTTFQLKDDQDLDKVVEQFTGAGGSKKFKKEIHIDDKSKGMKQNRVIVDVDIPEIPEKDRQRIHDDIERSMDDMRKGLKEMHKSLQSMHIYISDDDDNLGFNFDFEPGDFHDFNMMFDEELDSLRDKDHVIIVGDEGEQTPVLEKVISKNGKQVFVYKRVNPKPKQGESQWIDGFECYPNPSSGKFTVRFSAERSFDLQLKITDSKGNSVYSENLNDFEGSFSKEIDLTSKGKGSYLLTVSDNDNSLTKKIVLE